MGPKSSTLTHSGRLCRLEVSICQSGHIRIFKGEIRKIFKNIDDFVSHQNKCVTHDYQVGVVPYITTCGTKVNNSLCIGAL